MNATGPRASRGLSPPGIDLPPALEPAPPAALHRFARRLRRLLSPARIAALFSWSARAAAQIRRRRRETRLTVAVDINSYFEPLTGIGWYLHFLLTELAGRADLRLRLYAHRLAEAGGGLQPLVALPSGPAIEWVRYPIGEDMNVPAGMLAKIVSRLAPALAALDGNEVVFAPNFLPPPLFRFCAAPLVATIQDLTVRHFPDAVRPDTRLALERRLGRVLASATLLLTPSAAVRDELLATGIAPARVRAVRYGPGLLGERAGHQDGAKSDAGPGVEPPYALWVGTLEPRKNIATLLAAWPRLAAKTSVRLVLCGARGWASDELRQAVATGLAEGWLLQLDYVPEERLAALYRHATVVVFPSLYEGFGLPAAEALAAGAPLVCSDIPVLREVAGDAAIFVPPLDVDALAAALDRVLGDPALRDDLARRGREQATTLSWAAAADATMAAWRAAARGER